VQRNAAGDLKYDMIFLMMLSGRSPRNGVTTEEYEGGGSLKEEAKSQTLGKEEEQRG